MMIIATMATMLRIVARIKYHHKESDGDDGDDGDDEIDHSHANVIDVLLC